MAAKVRNFFAQPPLVLALDGFAAGEHGRPARRCACAVNMACAPWRFASRIRAYAAAVAVGIPVLPPSRCRERPLNMPEGSQKPEKPRGTSRQTDCTVITTWAVKLASNSSGVAILIVVSSVGIGGGTQWQHHNTPWPDAWPCAGTGVGDTKARIFCQQLSAELISIAGHYKVSGLRRDQCGARGIWVQPNHRRRIEHHSALTDTCRIFQHPNVAENGSNEVGKRP